jgi:hypothetical protein
LILRAVHRKDDRKGKADPSSPEESDPRSQLLALLHGPEAMPSGTIAVVKQLPPHLAELANWADEQIGKLNKHA